MSVLDETLKNNGEITEGSLPEAEGFAPGYSASQGAVPKRSQGAVPKRSQGTETNSSINFVDQDKICIQSKASEANKDDANSKQVNSKELEDFNKIKLSFQKKYKNFIELRLKDYFDDFKLDEKINPITKKKLNEKEKKKFEKLFQYEYIFDKEIKYRENFFNHQIESADKLFNLHKKNISLTILNDEAGCGKTITYLLFLKKLKEQNLFYKSTVICDSGLINQWIDDIKSMNFTYKIIKSLDSDIYVNNEDILIVSTKIVLYRHNSFKYKIIFGYIPEKMQCFENPNYFNCIDFLNKRYICFDELTAFKPIFMSGLAQNFFYHNDEAFYFLPLRRNLVVLSADTNLVTEFTKTYMRLFNFEIVKSNSNFTRPEIIHTKLLYNKNNIQSFMNTILTNQNLIDLENCNLENIYNDATANRNDNTEKNFVIRTKNFFLNKIKENDLKIKLCKQKENLVFFLNKIKENDLEIKKNTKQREYLMDTNIFLKKRIEELENVLQQILEDGCLICCEKISLENVIFTNCCLNSFCCNCMKKIENCPMCRGVYKVKSFNRKIGKSFFNVFNKIVSEIEGKTLIISSKNPIFFKDLNNRNITVLTKGSVRKQNILDRYFDESNSPNRIDLLILNSEEDCHGLRLENTKNIIFEKYIYTTNKKIEISEDLKIQVINRAIRINRKPNFTLNVFEICEG